MKASWAELRSGPQPTRVSWFEFVMPGQPPSWNHMYRWGTKKVDGREIRVQVKTDEASLYQAQLTMLCRAAKPSGFRPEGEIVVVYDMDLARDLDCDNVLKAVNDALAVALEVNDKRFLPAVRRKRVGSKDPQLLIGIYDGAFWNVDVG